jgi:hypothetical protein
MGLAKAVTDPSSSAAIALSATAASVILALGIDLLIEKKIAKAIKCDKSNRTLQSSASRM